MERNPKVYKIWKADKSAKKLVGASTFDELSEKVEAKFAFKGHFCLEDGTEIEDDDALWSLDTDKIIYLCNDMPFIPEKLDLSTSDSDATVLNSSSTSSSDETSKNSGLFPIPLERFPYGFRLSLNKRNRPSPSDKRGAAKVLADKVVELNGAKGRKVFFSIARNVVELSPKSFSTDIGDGIEAFAGLIENAYYNHPVVRQRSKGSLKSKLQRDEKGSRKRKGSKDAYGCVEWQPDSYGDDETEDSQNQKQKWLQQQSTVEEKDLMKIKEYMTITYPSQRFFINQEPAKSMECVREEWPFLFDVPHYEAHFCRLTGTSPEIYQDNMEKKSQLLYKFFMEPNQSEHFKKWQTSIDEAKVVTGNNLPIVGGVVLMAMNYFKEDNKTLFFEVDEEDHIGNFDEDVVDIASPSLLYAGENPLISEKLAVTINRKPILFPSSFFEGLKHMFMAYYIFNFQYPDKTSATLEMMQRFFFGIKPETGKKRNKKYRRNIHPKVEKLCENMFEAEWL